VTWIVLAVMLIVAIGGGALAAVVEGALIALVENKKEDGNE
jgi:hypothetical protein